MPPEKQINQLSCSLLKLQSFHSYFKTCKQKEWTWKERMLLRKTLAEKLQQKKKSFLQQKKNLNKKIGSDLLQPGFSLTNSMAAISISHCPVFGGFVFSFDKGISLGVDVEMTKRVGIRSLSRISTTQERNAAPSPPISLWTAKEAAFKCAHTIDSKLKFLSECIISNWHQKESTIYCFSFETNQSTYTKGQGFVLLFKDIALALTATKSTRLSNGIKTG